MAPDDHKAEPTSATSRVVYAKMVELPLLQKIYELGQYHEILVTVEGSVLTLTMINNTGDLEEVITHGPYLIELLHD